MAALACAGAFMHVHRSGVVHTCCYSHTQMLRHLTIRSICREELCVYKSTQKKQACYSMKRVGDFGSEVMHRCACKYIYLYACVCVRIFQ